MARLMQADCVVSFSAFRPYAKRASQGSEYPFYVKTAYNEHSARSSDFHQIGVERFNVHSAAR